MLINDEKEEFKQENLALFEKVKELMEINKYQEEKIQEMLDAATISL